jgi:hypothetical protein
LEALPIRISTIREDRHHCHDSKQRKVAIHYERRRHLGGRGSHGDDIGAPVGCDDSTRVRYVANGTFTGFVRFDFVAWDQTAGTNGTKANVANRGGSTPYSVNTDSAFLIVNTAPVLNTAGTPVVDAILVDAPDSTNTGTLIADLIASMEPAGGITDVDPQPKEGIAVTSANQLNGRWQYSTSSSVDWQDFGTGNINKWLLLASDEYTRIRFVPKPGFKGTARLNFIAWTKPAGRMERSSMQAPEGAAPRSVSLRKRR